MDPRLSEIICVTSRGSRLEVAIKYLKRRNILL